MKTKPFVILLSTLICSSTFAADKPVSKTISFSKIQQINLSPGPGGTKAVYLRGLSAESTPKNSVVNSIYGTYNDGAPTDCLNLIANVNSSNFVGGALVYVNILEKDATGTSSADPKGNTSAEFLYKNASVTACSLIAK